MTRDNKRAPLDDDDDFGGESHAADEPTAVWDEQALRAAGLTDLLKRRTSDPPDAPGAAPTPAGDAPSIVVDQSVVDQPSGAQSAAARATQTRKSAPPPASTGLGWGATLGIALALGMVVYFLIRYLKG